MNVVAYLLGLITLPVILAYGWGLRIAFSRSDVIAPESRCDWCEELGWRETFPTERDHRLNITQGISEFIHYWITARRLPHRKLWQAHFEKHPKWMLRPDSWKRFGTGPIAKDKS